MTLGPSKRKTPAISDTADVHKQSGDGVHLKAYGEDCHEWFRTILRYIWAFPATAIGLALAVPACAFGASVVITDGALEITGGGLAYASRLPRPLRFNAITFGHVIIGLSAQLLAACRAHEQVHVRQYERWGILFFPLYVGSSLLQIFGGRSPYWDNHFERQAYGEEGSCARHNVRSTVPDDRAR